MERTVGYHLEPQKWQLEQSSNWSPSGVPVAGDDVVLGGTSTYKLTLNVSATPNLHSLTINDSHATLAIGSATLNVTGTSSTAINVTAGDITIAGGKINDGGGMALASSSSSLSGWGSVTGSLSGNGTVTASAGTLDLAGTVNGPQLLIATAAGSDLKIDGTAAPTGSIAISSANQTLEIGAVGSLAIGAAETVSAGHIQLDGGSLFDAAGIVLSTGATLSGKGTVSATVSGAGTITANGGILEFKTAVDGSGTTSSFQIANVAGSDLQFDSSVGAPGINPIVTFNGATGLLDLGSNLGTFQGVIANFASGDAIKVAGATSATSRPARLRRRPTSAPPTCPATPVTRIRITPARSAAT